MNIKLQEQDVYCGNLNCEQTNIDCDEDLIYQISGNNIDGFIITNWK